MKVKKDVGVIIVVFGMVNLIIWKYLKYNSIEVESTIIKKESFLNKSRYNRYSKMRYFRIKYSIDNEIYENFIDADKNHIYIMPNQVINIKNIYAKNTLN